MTSLSFFILYDILLGKTRAILYNLYAYKGYPDGSDGKEFSCNAWDLRPVPGLGRSPGGGHGNPLQYSCLGNPMDRGAWRATVHRAVKSWTQPKGLSRHTPCVRHVSKHLTSIQSRNLHNNPISIVHYHYFIDEDAEAENLSDLLRIPQLAGATADI